MSQGNLTKWHVKPGDEVKPGSVLADVETDKAVLAFENQDEGFIAKLLVADGARDIPVGKPVAVLVEDAGSVAAFANYSDGGATPMQAAPAAPTLGAASVPAAPARSGPGTGYPPLIVEPSDATKPGDVLGEIETGKATQAFANVSSEGFINRILVPAGSRDIAVVEHTDKVPAFADYGAERPAAVGFPASPAAAAAAPLPQRAEVNCRLGPAARILLEAAGLSPADVTPTGPKSIITKSDVLAALTAGVPENSTAAMHQPAGSLTAQPAVIPASPAAQPAAPPTQPLSDAAVSVKPAATPAGQQQLSFIDTANSQIRRVIAKRLLNSKLNTPAIYLSVETQLDAIADLRAALAAKGTKVSVNDCVLRAAALALRDVPTANVALDEAAGVVVPFAGIDISFAVSTDKGLITPIVKAADTKGLLALSREVRSLAMRARENKLKLEEFLGGSFTVSNLGMYGLSYFSAIINPPQAAILAIGGGQERVVLQGGEPVVTTAMTVTLSVDARVYDGELAGAFLDSFRSHVEKPYELVGRI